MMEYQALWADGAFLRAASKRLVGRRTTSTSSFGANTGHDGHMNQLQAGCMQAGERKPFERWKTLHAFMLQSPEAKYRFSEPKYHG